MTDSAKSGFFKSLFGGRKTLVRKDIPLHIPLNVRTEKDAGLNVETMWNQVVQRQLGPLPLLHEANRYLEKINPLPLPYEQRTRLSNMLLSEVVSAVGSLFARFFQQGGGIPETREQRETIAQGVRAAEQLAISYKLLFRRDWADPDQSRPAQERTTLVALRIFECVRLEQLLLAFRYQKLPQRTWRDVNQLFFALRAAWDTKAKYPLKIQWLVEDGMSRVELFPKTANLQQLYLSIQLTGLLDVISWPVHLAYRSDGYLSAVENPLVDDEDRLGDIPAGFGIIYRDHGGPPRFSRSQELSGETLLIDLNPFIRMAAQDRAALAFSAGGPALSAALQEMPQGDRAPFLDLLLHRLQPQQRHERRQRVFNGRHARVYGGFEAVYRLFHDIGNQDKDRKRVMEERRFWDTLAEHTNIVADSVDGLAEPRWIIADEGSGGIQLHAQEGEYGIPIYIGRLVAYNSGAEDLAASNLGYVVRLQRTGVDEVEIAIARLREKIYPAAVEGQGAKGQQSVPALLIRAVDGKWQLLCDNKHRFKIGDRVTVVYEGHREKHALGDALIAQADFTVFELHDAA